MNELPDDSLHGESIVNSDIDIYAGQMKQYETKSDENMSLFEKKFQRRNLFRRNRGPPSRPIPPPYHRIGPPQETTTLSFMDDFDQSLLQITTPTTTTTTTTEKTTTTTPPPIEWAKISGETFGDWLGGVHYKYPTKYSDVTPQFLAPINVDDETGDLQFIKSNALLTESGEDKSPDIERQSPQAESRHDEKGGVEVKDEKSSVENDPHQTTESGLSLYHGGPALYRLPGPNGRGGPGGNGRRGYRGRFLPNGRFVSRPPFRGGPRGRYAATRRYANGPNGPRGPPLFNQRGQSYPPFYRSRGPPLGGRYRGRQNVGPPLPSHIEGGPSLDPGTYSVEEVNGLPPPQGGPVGYDGAPSLTSNGNYEIHEGNEGSPY
ncbi:collagen alpha-1(XXVII) chain-like [Tigriopus californicus]|uniref:collagen alpha-1(XXVII) chain-like n=1 Tax=Tigriopus californicus TaxID=6832 RepID=UPI0027DAA043|nr:collagen alpha-1(XXVII) chain-like [Tigriopus californicus]